MRTKLHRENPVREAAVAHGLPGVSPQVEAEVRRLSREVRRYVAADTEEQRTITERLMVEGANLRQITRVLRTITDQTNRARWPNITTHTVRRRMDQVRALRREEARNDRVELRELMVERLTQTRQRAMTSTPPDFKTAIACEREIAKLHGLYAPTKIEVDANMQHSQAMVTVIANMDPERAAELLDEAKTEKRLAARARELLPGIIDVEGSSSDR